MKTRTRSQISRQNRLGGAKAERDVRKWLIGLGFEVSQRQAQYRSGSTDGCELVIGGKIPVEVKRTRSIGLGTSVLAKACAQAFHDSKLWHERRGVQWSIGGHPWAVIWRPTGGRQHFLTAHDDKGHRFTLDTDTAIASWIENVLKK